MELLISSRQPVPQNATGPPKPLSEQGLAAALKAPEHVASKHAASKHELPKHAASEHELPGHEASALTSIGLCAAWSRHAAELAVPLGAALQLWEETPSTSTLVADGFLVRILPGIFLPPDLLRSAVQRALALGCALGAQLQAHHVIAGPSAAWVVLGGPPPPYVELLSPAHRGDQAGVVLRHARLQPDEVETIGGAPVTIPVRTAMDLLRFAPSWVAEPTLQRLVAEGHAQVPQIRERLHLMYRHPGVQAARERLEQMVGDQRGVSGVPVPTGLPSAVTR